MLDETYKEVEQQFYGVDVKKFNLNSKLCISGLDIKPVATSHDVPSCGFAVGDFGIFTDTGKVTKEMKCTLPKLRGVLLESNHDIDMLINGPYPPYLKQRIISDRGHLNNICASQLVEELGGSLSFALLGHLSGTNNTPKVASSTFETIVKKKVDYEVCSREKETGVWDL